MKILGVDLGSRRLGLALSDKTGMIATPLEVCKINSPPAALTVVKKAALEHEVECIVVGLARRMNGKIGNKAKECLAFAEELKTQGFRVELWDERLSSKQAERSLRQAELSRKKSRQRLDAVAAQIILQGFLDSRSN